MKKVKKESWRKFELGMKDNYQEDQKNVLWNLETIVTEKVYTKSGTQDEVGKHEHRLLKKIFWWTKREYKERDKEEAHVNRENWMKLVKEVQ